MVEAGGLEEAAILSSNEANVTVRSGVGVTKKPGTKGTPGKVVGGEAPKNSAQAKTRPDGRLVEREGRRVAEVEINADASETRGRASPKQAERLPGTPGTPDRYTTHARMGEKCLEWLRKHLEKAGLMLWTDVNGDIVVSAPNVNQAPRYRFIRKRGEARSVCNVLSHNFRNDTTKRFSSVVVFGRGPGRKSGKGKIRGEFFDVEMLSLLEPRRRTKSFRDVNVFDELQAINHARNRLAEINRNAWQLSYVIQGHTAPTPSGGRAVITPDTIAQVEDDELGISGLFYVEAVEYSSPPTTTTVTLMRLTDCMWDKDPTIVEQVEQVTSGRKRRRRKKK
jgi:prophage tail gpP-like protein